MTKLIHKFQHPTLRRAQSAPHQWTLPNYDGTNQLEIPVDTSPPVPEEQNRRIRKIAGTLLYYARAVDCTMLLKLRKISEKQ